MHCFSSFTILSLLKHYCSNNVKYELAILSGLRLIRVENEILKLSLALSIIAKYFDFLKHEYKQLK